MPFEKDNPGGALSAGDKIDEVMSQPISMWRMERARRLRLRAEIVLNLALHFPGSDRSSSTTDRCF